MEPPPKPPTADEVAPAISRALKLDGFFPEFKGEHLTKLFPRSGLFAYPRETPVMQQGEAGRDLFIVYAGSVRVQQAFGSAAAELCTLGPGTLLGEIALVQDCPRTATVVASVDSQIYRLVFQDLLYVLKNNAELAEHLRALALQRLK